jgi:hypothetical protein
MSVLNTIGVDTVKIAEQILQIEYGKVGDDVLTKKERICDLLEEFAKNRVLSAFKTGRDMAQSIAKEQERLRLASLNYEGLIEDSEIARIARVEKTLRTLIVWLSQVAGSPINLNEAHDLLDTLAGSKSDRPAHKLGDVAWDIQKEDHLSPDKAKHDDAQ